MTLRPGRLATVSAAARTDATGTMWRLRSLVAMGHDSARIARALGVPPARVRRVVRGQARTITCQFQAGVRQLWDAWWDKNPPRRTPAQRRAAADANRSTNRGIQAWACLRLADGTRRLAAIPGNPSQPSTEPAGRAREPELEAEP